MSILVHSCGETSDLTSTKRHLRWDSTAVPGICWSKLEQDDNCKFKLTDNSHLVSSKIGTMKENVSCEKRAIA